MPVSFGTEIPASVDAYYNRILLVRALPSLLHDRWGQEKPLPTGSGTKVVRFRRYNAIAPNVTELTQGVTPAGTSFTTTDITATVRLYGDFVTIFDEVDFFTADPYMTEVTELLGEQAGQSVDITRREILVAGTSVTFSGVATSRATVSAIVSPVDFERIARTLMGNNSKMVTPGIRPTDGVGTNPIRPGYWAIVHPDVLFSLDQSTFPGFVVPANYPNGATEAIPYEVGAFKSMRFVVSTFAKVFAGAGASSVLVKNTGGTADVYVTLIFAANAYGVIPLEGKAMMSVRKPYGSSGTADPLNQRSTSGWRANTTTRILNDLFMTRLESAAAL